MESHGILKASKSMNHDSVPKSQIFTYLSVRVNVFVFSPICVGQTKFIVRCDKEFSQNFMFYFDH